MKYYTSHEYGCVYWLENGELFVAPWGVYTFNTDEGGAVERPHDEVPESYYEKVMEALK
jgi:hypothetical protein